MSFNDVLLDKRSGLAHVWMASHVERKVSKAILRNLNIPKSVQTIAATADGQPDVQVMQLRISGQLLLGVVRIYSRKAKYLMDDCSEALVQIRMAFKTAAAIAQGGGTKRRAADVDMPEHEQAGRANINLDMAVDQARAGEFDMLFTNDFGGGLGMWDDFDLQALRAPHNKKARGTDKSLMGKQSDINLPEADINLNELDADDHFLDEPGFGSQEFGGEAMAAFDADFDIGLDLDMDPLPITLGGLSSPGLDLNGRQEGQTNPLRSSSEVPSVELGRRAMTPMSHRADNDIQDMLPDLDKSLGPDLAAGGMTGDDLYSFQQADLDNTGNDLEQAGHPAGDRSESKGRASANIELTTYTAPRRTTTDVSPNVADQQRSGSDDVLDQTDIDLTPRTANRIAEVAAAGSAARKRKEGASLLSKQRPNKLRKQIVDSVIELQQQPRPEGSQSQSQTILGEVSVASRQERLNRGLLKDPKYLPRRSLNIELPVSSKSAHGNRFFPGMYALNEAKENVSFNAAPPGLPEELRGLFSFRLGQPVRDAVSRRGGQAQAAGTEVEIGRQQHEALASDLDLSFGGPPDSMGLDEFDPGHELDKSAHLELDSAADLINLPLRSPRAGTPNPGIENFRAFQDGDRSLLSVFDTPHKAPASQLVTPQKSLYAPSIPGTNRTDFTNASRKPPTDTQSASRPTAGWSENTVKALQILEHELKPKDAKRSLAFESLAGSASRKAASSMFFELLILGTRDCLQLSQPKAYGDIHIHAKDKLWSVCEDLRNLGLHDGYQHEGEQLSRSKTPQISEGPSSA